MKVRVDFCAHENIFSFSHFSKENHIAHSDSALPWVWKYYDKQSDQYPLKIFSRNMWWLKLNAGMAAKMNGKGKVKEATIVNIWNLMPMNEANELRKLNNQNIEWMAAATATTTKTYEKHFMKKCV